MKRPSALVTGATGFVGRNLAAALVDEGWEVHAVLRDDSNVARLGLLAERFHVHRLNRPGVERMREIVRDASPDVAFHLASLFLSEHGPDDAERLVASNVSFGAVLAEAMCQERALRLVNTGSSWQHYRGAEYSPVNLYAATKEAFEDVLAYYVEARGLAVITLKLFDTYGPDDPREKLIGLLLRAARSGKSLPISAGEQLLDLVHVDDVVRAYLRAAEILRFGAPSGHQRFGVSSGAPITLRALVAELEQVLGSKIPVLWGQRPYREREVMMPWNPDARLPDWHPKFSLRAGLTALAARYS